MNEVKEFEKIAPFLTHPLVLIGFTLLLLFGLLRALLKAGIIPKLDKDHGGEVVRLILKYGFIIALVTILLGFLIQGWNLYLSSKARKESDGQITSKIERMEQSLKQPLKELEIHFNVLMPDDEPRLSIYKADTERKIDQILNTCGNSVRCVNHRYSRTLLANGGNDDKVERVSFGAESPIFPSKSSQKSAFAVFMGQRVELYFYKEPIKPEEFEYPRGGARTRTADERMPDLTIMVDVFPWANERGPFISIQYNVQTKQFALYGDQLKTTPEEWATNNKISSLPDLFGAQLFIVIRQLMFPDNEKDQEGVNPDIHSFALTIGNRQMWISNKLQTIGSPREKVFTCILPDEKGITTIYP